MSKPSVLIATPAYGGMLTYPYFMSAQQTTCKLIELGIPHGYMIIPNESLISRGRNRCAHYALTQKFDKLFFIDADMGWNLDDFLAIYYSSKKVIGGTYPLKQPEIRLSYNPLPEHRLELEQSGRAPVVRTLEEVRLLSKKFANEDHELEVRSLPTGFMCIDSSILEALKPFVGEYSHVDTVDSSKQDVHWDFFKVGVRKGFYESEDWYFCSLVQEHLKEKVYLNTKIVNSHTGTFTYKA